MTNQNSKFITYSVTLNLIQGLEMLNQVQYDNQYCFLYFGLHFDI